MMRHFLGFGEINPYNDMLCIKPRYNPRYINLVDCLQFPATLHSPITRT